MKALKIIIIAAVVATGAWMLQGCGAMIPTPLGPAGLYTSITCPSEALAVECNANVGQDKVGRASAVNILGIISTGDFGINAAMQNGKIKKVHHVDVKIENMLGLFATKTLIVYGE
ncbi:MAG TPA: TRL-like family protein [Bacteroidales bacterium]|nr:TRL-like family protein [Bacteroidales bacterium]